MISERFGPDFPPVLQTRLLMDSTASRGHTTTSEMQSSLLSFSSMPKSSEISGRNSAGNGSNGSSVSSASTASMSTTSQIQNSFFEIMYLASAQNRLFWSLEVLYLLLDGLQILSFAADKQLYDWPYISIIQDGIKYLHFQTYVDEFGRQVATIAGVLLLIAAIVLCSIVYVVARSVQQAQVPHMILVRVIRHVMLFMTTVGFIPIMSVFASVVRTYASTDLNVLDVVIWACSALGAALFCVVVLVCSTVAYAFGYTSTNPLARLSARSNVISVIGRAGIVILFSIDALNDHPAVRATWLAAFVSTHALYYIIYIPYYRMLTNITRVLLDWVVLAPLVAVASPVAGIVMLCVSPIIAGLPLVMYMMTELPTHRFRASMQSVKFEHGEEIIPLELMEARPKLLLFPFQVEIASRRTRQRIKRYRNRIHTINRNAPMTILEFDGAVSDGGELNHNLLPNQYKEELALLHELIEQEVTVGMRLFQFARSRWRNSSTVAMTYILFTACYRGDTLQSAVNSTLTALSVNPVLLDIKFFAFVSDRYRNSLHGDSSVMEKLEAQRNMTTLLRSQRKLAEALGQFWTQINTQRTQQISLRRVNAFISSADRISVLLGSTEKLYHRLLSHPEPRVLRSYVQYVRLFNSADSIKDYTDELYGIADELEVVTANEKGKVVKAKGSGVKIARMDMSGTSVSFLSLHIRAIVSVLIIAVLFSCTIAVSILALQVSRQIVWQFVAISASVTGLQQVGMGLSALRMGNPTLLVGAVNFAGPLWTTVSTDMTQDYITAGLTTYTGSLKIYAGVDPFTVENDPYSVIDVADKSFYEDAIDSLIIECAHLLYTISDLISSELVTVPVFLNGVQTGTQEVGLFEYVTEVIHTAEGIGRCLMQRTTDGHTDGVTYCATEVADTLLEHEAALATVVPAALYNVGDDVFVSSQLFPLLELVIFTVIFVAFLISFLIVAVTLYVIPVTNDITFTVKLIGLFASIPDDTIHSLLDRFQSYRSSKARHTADQPSSAAMARRASMGAPIQGRRESKVLFMESDEEINARMTAAPDDQESTELDSEIGLDSDAIPSGAEPDMISDQEGEMIIHPHAVHREEDESDVPKSEEELFDAKSLAQPPVKHCTIQTFEGNKNSIRFKFAVRQVPMLVLWMSVFGFIYVVMNAYAVYQTSDVAQTAETILIQYRSMLLLRSSMQHIAAYSWDAASSPVTLETMEAEIAADSELVKPLLGYMAGKSADGIDLVSNTWDGINPVLKWASHALMGIMVTDYWFEGYFQADISTLMYDSPCVRLIESTCEADRPEETYAGLLNIIQAYTLRVELAVAELNSGTMYGPSHQFLNETVELDVTGGLLAMSGDLRARFSNLLTDTQTNMLLFMLFFMVLLGLFYVLYFFRTIVQMSKTRRQFSLLFNAMPRNELPTVLAEKFLEFFPDEEDI
ncbi:tmcB-like protein [Carpediemonas membranifera]|uniref:TmcB-like protein n=1 Tax=Carpediemonas membranifera TaxID=201153 RepID=A0A8J6AYL9_9EUKA|nr:tmcB-like protein [Carpediemonas membranifera]|eukprot:KAG9390439.1 tmcB-like protein [Carpediemonas membranifera]